MQKAPDFHHKIFYIRQIFHQPLDKFLIRQTSQTPIYDDKTTKLETLHTDDQAFARWAFHYTLAFEITD
jgi:hypothetical protein